MVDSRFSDAYSVISMSAYLVDGLVEHGSDATQIGSREDRCEHLALLPMPSTLRDYDPRSKKVYAVLTYNPHESKLADV